MISNGDGVDFRGPRFSSAIVTVRHAADLVGMPVNTLQSWTGQRQSRRQVVTRLQPPRRGWPSIPLVGLVEAATLRALLEYMHPTEVWDAAQWLRERYDTPHPLAHEQLVTDGTYAYVEEHQDQLYRLRTNQHVFRESIQEHLRPVIFAEDHYPRAYRVPRIPGVTIDPRFNAGRMAFERTRVPLFAIVGSLQAGDEPTEVADAYGLTLDEVRDVEQHMDWLAQAA